MKLPRDIRGRIALMTDRYGRPTTIHEWLIHDASGCTWWLLLYFVGPIVLAILYGIVYLLSQL